VATELQDVFRDGVAFVPLATVRDPGLVLEAIVEALGMRGKSAGSLEAGLIDYLRARQLLLVLDNFEQVLPARGAVAQLLESASHLRVVVTSREALGVYGEHVFSVPTLGLPPLVRERDSRDSRGSQASAAEVLFLERARAARPSFASDPLERPLVAEICRRLEGLPLALELAASRARSLSPRSLLDALGQPLGILATGRGPQVVGERQRSVRGALDWSYGLLEDGERQLLGRLAVFAAGATRDAIAAVCLADAGSGAVAAESLVDKSLLSVVDVAGVTRFLLLETIREYAQERLLATEGESGAEMLRRRHLMYFASQADRVPEALRGAGQNDALRLVQADHDNFRAALDFALAHGHAELASRLSAGLWPFWRARGFFDEGRRWLAATLAANNGEGPTALRANLLNGAGVLALLQSDYELATSQLTAASSIFRTLADGGGEAFALSNLGWAAHDASEYAQAQELLERSLALRRAIGDRWGEAWSLNNLGVIALERGEPANASKLFEASSALFRRVDDAIGLAQALSNLGWALQEQGDYARGTVVLAESLALTQQLEDARGVAHNLSNLGLMAAYRGDYGAAGDLFSDSLSAFQSLGDRRGMAEALEGLAGVSGLQSRPLDAARLFGVASALRDAIGAPLLPAEHSRYESLQGAAREQLAADAWDVAWAQGRAASLDEVVNKLLG
jgi:predicted ATPase